MLPKIFFLIVVFFCAWTPIFGEQPSNTPAPTPISESKNNAPCFGLIKIVGEINLENIEKIIRKLLEFTDNTLVHGVLLVVNSNGGQTGTSELLFREIKEFSSKKPVVALIANTCCSGAYKATMGAQWIVSPAAADVGSIGTIMTIAHHKNRHVQNNGYSADIEYEVFRAGKFKAFTNPDINGPLSAEEHELLQKEVDGVYQIFYTLVAQQRNLSLENFSEWADGKVFNGEQALALGLIDQIGGFTDAVTKLHELIARNGVELTKCLPFIE